MQSKVDPEEVQKLADEVRRAYTSVEAGRHGFEVLPQSKPDAFGNSASGPACAQAHHAARTAMWTLLKAFSVTVDSDVERLTSALKVYRQTDAEAADQLLEATRGRLDVLSTHLSKGDDEKQRQAQVEQINRLGQITNDHQNTVIAGDLNSSQGGVGPHGDAYRNLGRQGYDTDAGFIHDGKGGTSSTGARIDHVMPRGVGTSEATRWSTADHESDHDGIVTDIKMPNW
ncbi:hypothetical protein MOQ72_40210 [Saccharopolyspora sp. K220]|uniref:endonuclease/exonuclease/phosphatase family protein n=1 Tax=Saccharopolyspora soli TaxID=2926618 RepID=UPI001F5AA94E|nr:endonuclease/exonuclease/phosphatase family protein [Saccharopolyspora soli]MCI2423648.1 hypothetical protein [Saccharopolyspora soli]